MPLHILAFARTIPVLQLVYGLAATILQLASLRANMVRDSIYGDTGWDIRMIRYAAVADAFEPLVFYAAMALLTQAALVWLTRQPR